MSRRLIDVGRMAAVHAAGHRAAAEAQLARTTPANSPHLAATFSIQKALADLRADSGSGAKLYTLSTSRQRSILAVRIVSCYVLTSKAFDTTASEPAGRAVHHRERSKPWRRFQQCGSDPLAVRCSHDSSFHTVAGEQKPACISTYQLQAASACCRHSAVPRTPAIPLRLHLSFGQRFTHSVHRVPHAERWLVATRTAAPVIHDEIAFAGSLLNMSLLGGITVYRCSSC
jgi:hypothetical protein